MSRLLSEWQRLYACGQDAGAIDDRGQARALVLQLARPADWRALSRVWQGVQADLALPAPAIAVNGRDGYQLWFSLAQAVPAAQANAFLADLQARYLTEVAPERVSLWPVADAQAPHGWRHADPLPAQDGQPVLPDQWSAFVAPDLAPVFNDTPWLDIPPNLEGQADQLSRMNCVSAEAWAAACAQLRPASVSDVPVLADVAAAHAPMGPHTDPCQFLLAVMNDEAIAMALRIEAAKALLPFTPRT